MSVENYKYQCNHCGHTENQCEGIYLFSDICYTMLQCPQCKRIKNYIETILISKAESISIEVSENPSPSGDPWFNDPENMASVQRGIAEMKAGKGSAYSMDEIRELLGV